MVSRQGYTYINSEGISKVTTSCHRATRFKLCDTTYAVLGNIKVRIPIIDEYFVKIEARIMTVDVPLLLGLDVLNRLMVILNFNEFTMSSSIEN